MLEYFKRLIMTIGKQKFKSRGGAKVISSDTGLKAGGGGGGWDKGKFSTHNKDFEICSVALQKSEGAMPPAPIRRRP